MSKLREYVLWAPTRSFASLTNRTPGWQEDREVQYRITVRAYSIKQAYFLAGNRIRANGPGEVGIVDIRPPTKAVAPAGSIRGDQYVPVGDRDE